MASLLKNIIQRLRGLPPTTLTGRNSLLTGVPRSGTTLCCYLLSQSPNVVALNEAMRIHKIPEGKSPVDATSDFLIHNRHTLLSEGYAIARVTEKGITDNNFASEAGAERKTLVRKKRVDFDKPLSKDFHLLVKHNSFFTMLLEELRQHFPVYVIIRNPLAVLGSWNSLDIPVSRGEVNVADRFCPELQQALSRIPDLYERQLYILNWYFEQYLNTPDEQLIRYESVIASNGHELAKVDANALKLNKPLESKNKNDLYSQDRMKMLAESLLKMDSAVWEFYDRSTVEQLAAL